MLAKALLAFLTSSEKNTLALRTEEYTYQKIELGAVIFGIIVQESQIAASTSSAALQISLTMLDTYMPKYDNNITKFSLFVQKQVRLLKTKQESPVDLVSHLLLGIYREETGVLQRRRGYKTWTPNAPRPKQI